MGTFFHVLSEQYRTEQFFGAERSVLTEQLDPMFPRTLMLRIKFRTQRKGDSFTLLKLTQSTFVLQLTTKSKL